MKQETDSLQIQIHQLGNSTTTFFQNDPREVQTMLDDFWPEEIFNQERIIVMADNSITSLSVAKITRIDLSCEHLPRLVLPAKTVSAVELTESEFQVLIRNPVMREQWERRSTQDDTLVTFLDMEMADGQCLYLTMEMRSGLQSQELWRTNKFPWGGSGLCFHMRTGGIAVLNLAHLIRVTFYPKPEQPLVDVWHAQLLQSPRAHQITAVCSGARVSNAVPQAPTLPGGGASEVSM